MKAELQKADQLFEICHQLSSAVSVPDMLCQIITGALSLTNCELVSILIFNEMADELRFVAATSFEEKLLDTPIPVKRSIIGASLLTGEPIIVHDVRTDPRNYQEMEQQTNFVGHSLLVVPIQFQGMRIGVLEAQNKLTGKFDQEDVNTLTVLAAQSVIALWNTQPYDISRKIKQEWEQQVQEHTVELLAVNQALQISESRYRAIIEEQTEFVIRWLPDGTRTFVNQSYCLFCGRSYDELVGENFLNRLPEHEVMRLYRQIQALSPENPVTMAEYHSVQSARQPYWTRWIDRGIFDEAGNLVEIQSVGRDITPRKEAENKLLTSEKKLQAILESMDDLVFTLDKDGIFLDYYQPIKINQQYASPEVFLGKTYRDVLPSHLTVLFDAAIEQVVQTGIAQQIDYSLDISGRTKWFSANLSIYRNNQGDVDGVTVVVRNISERKQKEAALQKAHDHLAALLIVSNTVASTLDLDALLTLALEALRKVTKYTTAFISMREGDSIVVTSVLDSDSQSQFFDPVFKHISLADAPATQAVFATQMQYYIADIQKFPNTFQTAEKFTQLPITSITEKMRTWLITPFVVRGKVIGVLNLVHRQPDQYDTVDRVLVQTFANQMAAAIENVQLYERVQETAVLHERNRLAQELHDSVTQSLYSISLFTDASHLALDAGKVDVVDEHLHKLGRMARDAMADMRLLIFDLRPPILEEMGLAAALQMRLKAVEARAGMRVDFQTECEPNLPTAVEAELYRAALEGLNNVMKHARADRISVRLQGKSGRCRLVIEDNGIGFDTEEAKYCGGYGLQTMQERIQKVNGILTIDTVLGRGTKLVMEV